MKLQFEFPGFDLGEFEQIIRQAAQAHGVFTYDVQKAAAVFLVLECAAQQCFRKSLDRGERGLEFVGDIRGKITTRAFQPAQIR